MVRPRVTKQSYHCKCVIPRTETLPTLPCLWVKTSSVLLKLNCTVAWKYLLSVFWKVRFYVCLLSLVLGGWQCRATYLSDETCENGGLKIPTLEIKKNFNLPLLHHSFPRLKCGELWQRRQRRQWERQKKKQMGFTSKKNRLCLRIPLWREISLRNVSWWT